MEIELSNVHVFCAVMSLLFVVCVVVCDAKTRNMAEKYESRLLFHIKDDLLGSISERFGIAFIIACGVPYVNWLTCVVALVAFIATYSSYLSLKEALDVKPEVTARDALVKYKKFLVRMKGYWEAINKEPVFAVVLGLVILAVEMFCPITKLSILLYVLVLLYASVISCEGFTESKGDDNPRVYIYASLLAFIPYLQVVVAVVETLARIYRDDGSNKC